MLITSFSEMYLARNAPPRTARKVASACPAIAPPATPHGDCSQEVLEETIHLDIIKLKLNKVAPVQHPERLLQASSDLPIPRSKNSIVQYYCPLHFPTTC